MRRMFPGAAATAILIILAGTGSPAQAQRLGRILVRTIERTIERRADEAARQPERRREEQPAETVPADASAGAASTLIPAPPGVEPWPINAGHRAVTRPSQFAFSADMVARKQRFAGASSFPCSTCEGSLDFDTWRRALQPLRDTYSAWSAILEGWTVGRTIPWRGTAHDGQITVVSEIPVGGFRCRQLRHRITSRGRNPVSTERPGLICLGKRDGYSASETWHEVF